MGLNKKYISTESIKSIASVNDIEYFFNYFKGEIIITTDNFSSKILNEIREYSMYDKKDILRIMMKCK